MAITWTSDTTGADWLGATGAPWWQVVRFGPPVFEAYARLRYVPDPAFPGQREAEVDRPEDLPPDLQQARTALAVLSAFTSTPDDCWFAIWEGCSSSLELPPGLPLHALPHRSYGLLRGALNDLADWEETVRIQLDAPPAFVWPADRSWCFASDVDPHYAGVGASEAAVRALLAAPGLDAVRAEPSGHQPTYS
ncbi:hypothetical protein GCM10022197_41360 [Microlunatus spumicola]|uniref:DUF2716 domain-containing protein n=1 Tax=Microlunatus spumicola TaxID=81499 RepID=A0ABP6Y9P4_9ACTN